MNLAHMLLRSARRLPALPAVIERDRTEFDYARLAERALRLAAALRAPLGQEAGARVALVMQNNAAYVESLYACWAAGLAAIPINVKLHPREVAFILDDAGATLCFITEDVDTLAIDAARASPGTRFVDVDSGDYRKLLHAEPGRVSEVAPHEVAWLFYTSGTTGKPKGVMLTHANLLAAALNYLADVDHASPGEHLVHAAPMSHGSGLYIVPNIAAGCTQLIPASRGFDVAEIDTLLAFASDTKMFAAPTMVMRLVDAMRGDAQDLKSIIYGGGPMYVSDALRALERFGPRLTQIYGQGESPMTITVLPAADHVDNHDGQQLNRLASVGRAQMGVEVAVFDDRDRSLPEGEIGEVCVRADTVMRGYLNNPEATAITLANGWLHTGDLGRLDPRGYLTLVDRSKDLVISGGSNIYPREVEEVLLRHPSVREIAVIGERDREWGESLVAVVALRTGAAADTAALEALCLEHLARFKRPKRYVFVDDLPKNAAGKVLKRELRARLANP
ncbi:MAG TPA: AMP-binding protein [Burkholderiaceae bacterium]|nr:AMP-binding protein [Burkholderiaceae bacterium]